MRISLVMEMRLSRWLARQRQHTVWHSLTDEQRQRLEQFGITPLALEPEDLTKPSTTPLSAASRPLAQYNAHTGSVGPISRSHTEVLPDDTQLRLGVFPSNTKNRRTKLTTDKLQQPAAQRPDWA